MGKRLTVLATALLLVWSMTAAAFAKEPEISVEIDQTGQDSAVAVIRFTPPFWSRCRASRGMTSPGFWRMRNP